MTVTQNKDPSVIIQEVMAQATRYNDWIYSQFEPTIGRRILDIGCSIGNITEKYVDRDRTVGLEVVEESVQIVRSRFNHCPQFQVHHIGIDDPQVLTMIQEQFDSAVCFNVLEHIENDFQALVHVNSLLIPAAVLNLFVPACPVIFGSMDQTDHHFRRYTKASLRSVVTKAGFEIQRLFYFNILGFFGWFWNARVRRKQFVDQRSVALMERVVPLLAAIERVIPPPFGQSLVCIARKK